MSMLNRLAKGNDVGEMIASTRDYESAQKTVSKLIAGEVPARDIAIVGQGVRTVERVTGKLGYAAAARSGAINGVLIGLVLSAIMLFGNPDAQISLVLGFILIGVALGMIMSLITYAIVRRRRDFASVTQMIADHYEVRVQPASLAKAREVVGVPERPASTRPAVDMSEPPRYGERVPAAGAVPVVPGIPAGSAVPAAAEVPSVPEQGPETATAPGADATPGADTAPGADAADAASADATAGADAASADTAGSAAAAAASAGAADSTAIDSAASDSADDSGEPSSDAR